MHQLVLDLWERHRPAILLVTHDVDEALALADRVVLLADGRIAHEERISLERPRERENPDLSRKTNPPAHRAGRLRERCSSVRFTDHHAVNRSASARPSRRRRSPPPASASRTPARKVSPHKASATTPSAKVVAPAKKLKGVVLNVGDQAGTGAEAVLEAAGLLKQTAVLKDGLTSSGPTSPLARRSFRRSPPARSTSVASATRRPCLPIRPAKEVIVGVLKNSATNAALLVPGNSPITSSASSPARRSRSARVRSADYHLLTVLREGRAEAQPGHARLSVRRGRGLAALQAGRSPPGIPGRRSSKMRGPG